MAVRRGMLGRSWPIQAHVSRPPCTAATMSVVSPVINLPLIAFIGRSTRGLLQGVSVRDAPAASVRASAPLLVRVLRADPRDGLLAPFSEVSCLARGRGRLAGISRVAATGGSIAGAIQALGSSTPNGSQGGLVGPISITEGAKPVGLLNRGAIANGEGPPHGRVQDPRGVFLRRIGA